MARRSWTRADDGRRYTLKLRPDVIFSDGHPFTADDVVFSFEAAYDERVGSVLADSLQVGGKKLQVAAPDPHTVVITFPAPFAPGVRILDNLPILPRHKLDAALKGGTLRNSLGPRDAAVEIVGLGPFVLSEYVPGQRLVFARNPRYFARRPTATPLPYLDRIIVEIIPDQNAELLRLEAGQLDMMTSEIAPEDYAPLKRAADAGRVKLLDLGVGFDADSLWFNLKPGALGRTTRAPLAAARRAAPRDLDGGRSPAVRRHGVPRRGRAGLRPEHAGEQEVVLPSCRRRRTIRRARAQELASIGLADRNGDGLLEDADGRPARFTLLTQKGPPRSSAARR